MDRQNIENLFIENIVVDMQVTSLPRTTILPLV